MNEQPSPDSTLHRSLAARFFNDAWTLVDKEERTADEDLRMIHLAHASRLHWEFAGDASNLSIGEWQISRVYSILGHAEAALYHARHSLSIATEHNLKPFLVAYSCEAMARAFALTKDPAAGDYVSRAKQLVPGIEDARDRALLEADLATIGV